jgi:imidazole glycerol-phosphate synthase subunit HisH
MDIPLLIIDYGMGNLRSVINAFAAIDCQASISKNPEDMKRAKRIVLPGVGAFGDGMANLRIGGWVDALEEEIQRKGKPFLGLCLGMQLLATKGTEHGIHNGLNWIAGISEKIPNQKGNLRVPHIGWNEVKFTKKGGLYTGLGDSQNFYFVHSYYLSPNDNTAVNGVCEYGIEFAASIEKDNIFATQFHPEKSQVAGLTVLKNFMHLDG